MGDRLEPQLGVMRTMKIKIASTGHDMTYRVDRTGNTPKYWIIYDTVSQSFEVIHNLRQVEAGDESYGPIDRSQTEQDDGRL